MNTNNITISIIIPVFNKKDYLRECVSSISEQSSNNTEIILVDDGSTDGSELICDSISEINQNVKTLHTVNQGPLRARLEGLKIANGNYVWYVDADDIIATHAIQCLVDIISEFNSDIVLFNADEIWDSKICKKPQVLEEGYYNFSDLEIIRALACSGRLNNLCYKLIKKEILDSCALTDTVLSMLHGEDLALVLACLDIAKNAYCSNEYLYHYVHHASQATSGYSPSKLHDIHIASQLLNEYGKKWGDVCLIESRRGVLAQLCYLIRLIEFSQGGGLKRQYFNDVFTEFQLLKSLKWVDSAGARLDNRIIGYFLERSQFLCLSLTTRFFTWLKNRIGG